MSYLLLQPSYSIGEVLVKTSQPFLGNVKVHKTVHDIINNYVVSTNDVNRRFCNVHFFFYWPRVTVSGCKHEIFERIIKGTKILAEINRSASRGAEFVPIGMPTV